MDAQLKRGLLEVCVLSVISRGDSYGYKIIKDMAQCIKISESTLYPILKRLEGAGCLDEYSIEHNGRLRKVYKITDFGWQRIDEFLQSWKDVMAIYTFIKEGKTNDTV
jgi:PadR family transcriptional regulator PadR